MALADRKEDNHKGVRRGEECGTAGATLPVVTLAISLKPQKIFADRIQEWVHAGIRSLLCAIYCKKPYLVRVEAMIVESTVTERGGAKGFRCGGAELKPSGLWASALKSGSTGDLVTWHFHIWVWVRRQWDTVDRG